MRVVVQRAKQRLVWDFCFGHPRDDRLAGGVVEEVVYIGSVDSDVD